MISWPPCVRLQNQYHLLAVLCERIVSLSARPAKQVGNISANCCFFNVLWSSEACHTNTLLKSSLLLPNCKTWDLCHEKVHERKQTLWCTICLFFLNSHLLDKIEDSTVSYAYLSCLTLFGIHPSLSVKRERYYSILVLHKLIADWSCVSTKFSLAICDDY